MPKILPFFPGFLAEGIKEGLRFSAGPGVKCCRSYVTQEFYLRPKRAYCNPGILSNLRPSETKLAGIHGEFLRGRFMEYEIQRCQAILESRTVENNVVYLFNHVLLVSQHFLQSPYKCQEGVFVPIWKPSIMENVFFKIKIRLISRRFSQ